MTLDSLGGHDARRLVDALPERDALDDRLATAILESGRAPLFLEQLAAHAAEAGFAADGIRRPSTRCSRAASTPSSPASAMSSRGQRSSGARSHRTLSAR